MSEYAEICIGEMTLAWFRNYLDKKIVELFFSKNDLIVEPDYIEDPDDEDSVPYTRYMYQTTVKRAKERLDAMGFSLKHFETVFNLNMIQAIDYGPFLSHLRVDIEDYEEKAKVRIEKYVTFKKWQNSLDRIIKHELEHGNISSFSGKQNFTPKTECDKLIFYAIMDSDAESFYSLNTEVVNIAYVFRQILESCIDERIIQLDFSYLDNWAEDSIPKALDATGNSEKTIVLVEGSSDKDILEFAIKNIHPHLADLFYFMDFSDNHGNTRPGGTSEIKKQMEVFYYSRINAKFIAVFDNDAAGYQSMYSLLNDKIKKWPDNFRILCYPSNSFFSKYPTLAPSGQILNDDINGKACSIELYLPDRLIMQDGKLYPIEWESRQRIKKTDDTTEYVYQGVISNKDEIKKDFHALKNRIETGREKFKLEEWERMRSLLEVILFAFK